MAGLALLANLSKGGLLLRRHPSRGWELPGGKVEEGESPEEAVVRESLEEVGWRPARLRASVDLLLDGTPAVLFVSSDEPPASLAGCVFASPPPGLAFGEEEFEAVRMIALEALASRPRKGRPAPS